MFLAMLDRGAATCVHAPSLGERTRVVCLASMYCGRSTGTAGGVCMPKRVMSVDCLRFHSSSASTAHAALIKAYTGSAATSSSSATLFAALLAALRLVLLVGVVLGSSLALGTLGRWLVVIVVLIVVISVLVVLLDNFEVVLES